MIQLQDFHRMWEQNRKQILEAVESVGNSGFYILGPKVKNFEATLEKTWGLKHAVSCASGMDAIQMALMALGAKEGDLFLTTPLSAFATTLAGIKLGMTPVFCDTDKNGNIDLDIAADVFEKRKDIKFFVPVHLYGRPLNLEKLKTLREKYSLKLVEDCAQAIGAEFNNKKVGSVGDLAALSLYPTKNLGALGDGGAVLTNNTEFAAHVTTLRDYGQSEKYRHTHLGLNSRFDELHAAIVEQVFLPQLSAWTKRRTGIAKYYFENLRNENIQVPTPQAGEASAHHLFPVFVKERNELQSYLKSKSVGSAIHYPWLIPDQPAMEKTKFEIIGDLKNAKTLAETEVSLPLHPWMTDGEVETVAKVCNQWKKT